MPRPRFERAAPELRDAVLDAAAAEFGSQGYEGASINRILAAAGQSKGAFYYYFDDKADLAAAVLERETRAFLDNMGDLPQPETVDDFWATVWQVGQASLRQLRTSSRGDAYTRLAMAFVRDPLLKERLGPLFQEARARLEGFWKRGQEVGAVRTDLPLGALLATIEGMKMATAAALLPADGTASARQLEEFTRIHLDLVRRVVTPAPPPGPKRGPGREVRRCRPRR